MKADFPARLTMVESVHSEAYTTGKTHCSDARYLNGINRLYSECKKQLIDGSYFALTYRSKSIIKARGHVLYYKSSQIPSLTYFSLLLIG